MTARQASKVIRDDLVRRKVVPTKISAKTVSFSGFGYGEKIFVDVFGLLIPGNLSREAVTEIQALAHTHGFIVHFV
jgi:hypothetical protein